MQPAKIITEMPVNIGTALYFSKVSSKLFIGVLALHVPWFDNVLLVPELVNKT